ncbi:ferritin [Hippea maritima]|uniref:Ferritin n=1 Tax=Hippea maritima (strain ATCC 700847 / DSM 10411 / MH2) TaxID=760142 RepID=F2LTZ1_HIPMA|nr:ferritin [Hippea maritima]AEA33390.1 Ferroxidase [Hippea maritima DSM 10411]
MISKRMEEALNNQINEELYSAYLYLSMSAWFDSIGLKGFANWMMVQYKEETDHAMKLFNYLARQGAKIELKAIAEPPKEWKSPLHAMEETLKHEQHITKCINELVDLAEKLKDRATYNMLQWFVDEQVEEEENDRDIIDKLKLVEDSKHGILLVDKELAQRQYTPEV